MMSPPMRDYDNACMMAAIHEARIAASAGCMPFGAVLADDTGTILERGRNACPAAQQRGGGCGDRGSSSSPADVTRHAEMELIRKFTTTIPADGRSSCTLYTSTEPCVMCAGAIYWSGVGRVVYGCSAVQLETLLSGPGGFDVPLAQLYGLASPGARKIEVEGPFLAKESLQAHDEANVWIKKLVNSSSETPVAVQNKQPTQADLDIAIEASLKDSGLGSAKVVDDGVVPIIDMSGTKEQIANQLWEAATKVGFFSVINHGIDQALVDQAFEMSAKFFEQSVEEKEQQSPGDMSVNSGFEYFSQVRPSTGVADQKESLQITARQGCMDGRWPSPEFREMAEAFLQAANQLAGRILDLLEPRATPQVPQPGTLAKSHTLWGDDGQCTLRFLHYPAMPPDVVGKLLEDGYWRAGPHTDWDNITLLFQRPGQGGLECCANPRTGNAQDMYWTAVNPVPGGIAVNIGDMLARWSDGKLHSNLHRVRLPQDASQPRYSIAFFAQSDKKTLIESNESEPITAGSYILSRIQSNFSK
jgi:isopenicillin N synthase-like dioxygenase/tRNA(Arg) A34 adenosine deaminase TadA